VLKSWQVTNTTGNYYWAYWLTTNTLTGNNVTPGAWTAEATFKGLTLVHWFNVFGPAQIGAYEHENDFYGNKPDAGEKVFDSFSWYDTEEQKLITDFTEPLSSKATMMLFSLSGKQIVSENISAGIQTAEFSLKGLSSGIYICKVIAGEKLFTHKIMIGK
jgi:hypothetical protein